MCISITLLAIDSEMFVINMMYMYAQNFFYWFSLKKKIEAALHKLSKCSWLINNTYVAFLRSVRCLFNTSLTLCTIIYTFMLASEVCKRKGNGKKFVIEILPIYKSAAELFSRNNRAEVWWVFGISIRTQWQNSNKIFWNSEKKNI